MVDLIKFNESNLMELHPELLDILLCDRSSDKNIKWCTDNYRSLGIHFDDYIIKENLCANPDLIKSRIYKSQIEQKKRSKGMAEVFTPSWICNKQNNLIDDAWFGYVGAFNEECGNGWNATYKVKFCGDRTWQDYVELVRMEITCGEAPYLTSRYDATNGAYISPKDRIGLLDRKLRVISENVDKREEWLSWALTACQRIYGYEYQGDSLLLARENLLMTFVEFYSDKFSEQPTAYALNKVAQILSWNIFQMDGLKYVIPNSCQKENTVQLSMFGERDAIADFCKGCKSGNNLKHNGIYCRIKDWKQNKTIKFIDLIKSGDKPVG